MKKIGINHSSLSSAFQHVKENHGCAGVDGVTIERFEENLDLNLARLQDELEKQIYFPRPLMKILVEKKNGEARALCIPAVRDRVVETAVLQIIGPVLEKG
jgi:retron-type reverse transcriptase